MLLYPCTVLQWSLLLLYTQQDQPLRGALFGPILWSTTQATLRNKWGNNDIKTIMFWTFSLMFIFRSMCLFCDNESNLCLFMLSGIVPNSWLAFIIYKKYCNTDRCAVALMTPAKNLSSWRWIDSGLGLFFGWLIPSTIGIQWLIRYDLKILYCLI
jgi:hypothetical protein